MKPRISRAARAIQPTLIRQITDRARPSSLHLGLGQPDLPVSEPVRDAVEEFLGRGLAPYTPNLGADAAREAVARHYGIDASEVMLTCGVQEAMAVAILGLVERGDEVLVPDPGFPAYPNLVRAAGGTPVPYRLDRETWGLDVDAVREAAADETRAIVLNTPSNPTGGVHDEDGMRDVLTWCAEHDVVWISDEIYEDFVYMGEHYSATDFDAFRGNGVRLSGLSKSHAMMGWRIGWMTGDVEWIEALKPLHQHLVTCAPTPSQLAAMTALSTHRDVVESVRGIFDERRRRMLTALDHVPGIEFVEPSGAFYVLVDVSAYRESIGDSLAVAEALLDEVDVVTIPGSGFGEAGEGYLRLAYTVDADILVEAVERIGDHLQRVTGGRP